MSDKDSMSDVTKRSVRKHKPSRRAILSFIGVGFRKSWIVIQAPTPFVLLLLLVTVASIGRGLQSPDVLPQLIQLVAQFVGK